MPNADDSPLRGADELMRDADEMMQSLAPPSRKYPPVFLLAPDAGRSEAQHERTTATDGDADQFRRVFDMAVIGMAIVGIDGRFLAVNQAMCDITGYDAGELTAKTFQAITHPDDLKFDLEHVRRLVSGAIQSYQIEKRYIHQDGHPVWVQLSVSLVRDEADAPCYFVAQVENIEARKFAESQLIHQAFHDPLTGLPNRALFMDRLEHALARAKRSGEAIAVLFLDLDNFKAINDHLGHRAGDELLSAIADRLRLCVRPGDTVARLGGDEFTVLLEGIVDVADATRVAQRISEQSLTLYSIAGRAVTVSASIGIAVSSAGVWAEDLLRNADTAMYEAKRRGRSRYEVFVPGMALDVRNRLELSLELQRAIEHNELTLHYQPVIDVATGKTVSLEALVRWEHPQRGLLLPGAFIPTAEESGLITDIGAWVLQQACLDLQRWQREYPDVSTSVSVNLSLCQFLDPVLVSNVATTLRETGIDPQLLHIEIPESTMLEDTDDIIARIRALKDLGVAIVIDDFGRGASSLRFLSHGAVDLLKIDQHVVAGIGSNPKDTTLVEAAIAIGRAFGLNVVAEGVERHDQYLFLKAINFDRAQGNFICAAVPAEQIDTLLGTGIVDQISL